MGLRQTLQKVWQGVHLIVAQSVTDGIAGERTVCNKVPRRVYTTLMYSRTAFITPSVCAPDRPPCKSACLSALPPPAFATLRPPLRVLVDSVRHYQYKYES